MSIRDGMIVDMSITVDHLTLTYPGGKQAIKDISFHAGPGTVVGLLGVNGAGKSSAMRVLATAQPPTSGTVHIGGHNVATHPDHARAVLGYCPDVDGLPRAQTLRECIGMALAASGNLDLWPQALELVERFKLDAVLDVATGTFSHGMARRTSALLAVLTARQVLLLDEPFDGVDALGAALIIDLVATARERGLTVVVCTHLVDLVAQVADQVVVMVDGRVVAHGGPGLVRGRRGRRRYASLLTRGGAA